MMNRRDFLRAGLAATAALTMPRALWAADEPARPPNFLLILADDMGFSDIGCYGGEIATPNIDALAGNGLRFTQAYNTARCWPTRCCILTGQYEQQTTEPFQSWTKAAPHHLKGAGYRCYHSGKWHVRGAKDPLEHGEFDTTTGIDENQHFSGPNGEYANQVLVDHAIGCLQDHTRNHADKPFFSYLAFHVPHFPLQAPQEDIDRYRARYLEGWDVVRERRWQRLRELGIVNCGLAPLEQEVTAPGFKPAMLEKLGDGEMERAVPWADLTEAQRRYQATKMAIHAAMVENMDRQIGRVIDHLRATGQFDNTVVMFASDNGASAEILIRGRGHDPAAPAGSANTYLCLGPGWSSASNAPFRRHKIWSHEGGIATPFIVHWPKGITARGERRRDLTHVIDVVPTMLDLAGVRYTPPVGAPPMAGHSLAPAFAKDGAASHDELYFNHQGNYALRDADWKLIGGKDSPQGPELYDMRVDRCEQVNLAAKEPDRVQRMRARWQALTRQFAAESGRPVPATGG